MTRLKSWGLLLGISIPLLFYFSWTRLQNEKARINLDRFAAAGDVAGIGRVLTPFYLKNKKIAVAGDVKIPAVPAKSGVKAWALRSDGVVQVELDAKADGEPVKLLYVPVVRVNNVIYDCLSTTPAKYVGKFCYAETLAAGQVDADASKLEAMIKTQLAANQQAINEAPAVLNASGDALSADAEAGSVLAVPSKVSDLDKCGFQCVKPQSCVTPRPLACSKLVTEGNSGFLAIAATPTDYRGSNFASLSEADKICEQQLGAGYKVLEASSISGKYQLSGDTEYWVNNRMQAEKNCWKAG
jgi:hypothetical protein